MLPEAKKPEALLPSRSNCESLRGNPKENGHPPWRWIQRGWNVGCDFAKQKETDPELAEFLEHFEFVPPLEPRDAFFGGRTGAATLYSKTAEDEEISYVDFTSLCPSINKYGT